jgi:hypothetical protein
MEKFVSLVSFVAHSRETKQGDAKDAVCVLRRAQHDRGLGDGRLVEAPPPKESFGPAPPSGGGNRLKGAHEYH